MQTTLLELALLMGWLKLTPAISYTAFNLMALALVLLRRCEALYPVLFTNTLALHASFYLMQVFVDRTFCKRMRDDVYKCNTTQFILGDIAIHVLPSVFFLLYAFTRRDSMRQIAEKHPILSRFSGFYSLFLNLCWAMLNVPSHFDISNVYVPLPIEKWSRAWHACALCHLVIGGLLSRWVSHSSSKCQQAFTNRC